MTGYELGPDDYRGGADLMLALLAGLRMLGMPVDYAAVDDARAIAAAEELLAAIGVPMPPILPAPPAGQR